MDLGSALSRSAERFPRRRAVGGPRPLTYAQWDRRTDQLARGLLARGVRPGQRVLALLRGGEPLASLHLAANKLGAVSVPLSVRFAAAEVAYCLRDCAPALVVADETTEATLAEGLRWADAGRGTAAGDSEGGGAESGGAADRRAGGGAAPDRRAGDGAEVGGLAAPPVTDVADLLSRGAAADRLVLPPPPGNDATSVMLYTSGTTGRPKGVPRSHRAEYAAAVAHLIQTRQPLGAISLGVMPLFHTMGLRTLLASVVGSGTWVPQAAFDAAESAELIEAERVDTLYLVPTAYWSLARTGRLRNLRSVRRLAYAGAPMSPALTAELVETVGPDCLVNHFGSTEIYTFSVSSDAVGKPGCAGRAGVFGRLRLISPEPGASPGATVPDGEPGQVIVAMDSPEAFGGYWRRPDADAKAIRDGWYYTGDLGRLDDDGDLWVSGRVDDMINSGGENIYPDEIERVLASAPGVDQVVVSGTPHEKWGSAVTAFFVPSRGPRASSPGASSSDSSSSDSGSPGASGAGPGSPDSSGADGAGGTAIARLDEWVRTQSGLPSMKRPKRYVAVASIPTSAVGKILRRQLSPDGPAVIADSYREAGGHPEVPAQPGVRGRREAGGPDGR